MTSPTSQEPNESTSSPEEASTSPLEEASNSPLEEDLTTQNWFLASTLEELKLVVWPSRQQLFSESIAVILMVTLSAASIAAVSRFYAWGAAQIFR